MNKWPRYHTVTHFFRRPIWDVFLGYAIGVVALLLLINSYNRQMDDPGYVSSGTRTGIAVVSVYFIYTTVKIVYGLCSKATRKFLFEKKMD